MDTDLMLISKMKMMWGGLKKSREAWFNWEQQLNQLVSLILDSLKKLKEFCALVDLVIYTSLNRIRIIVSFMGLFCRASGPSTDRLTAILSMKSVVTTLNVPNALAWHEFRLPNSVRICRLGGLHISRRSKWLFPMLQMLLSTSQTNWQSIQLSYVLAQQMRVQKKCTFLSLGHCTARLRRSRYNTNYQKVNW